MSSNVAPPYNERNPFVRLADSWYGLSDSPVNSGSYGQLFRDLFLPDETMGDMSSRGYWSSDIPSDLAFLPGIDPASPVGYLRFNTGRPTMDAIATVVLNNVGIDNLLRGKSGVTRGDWGAYFRNVPLGTIEALSAAAGIGAIGKMGVRALSKTAARGTGLPTMTSPVLGIPLQGPTQPTVVRGIQNAPAAVRGWGSNVAQNVASRWDPAKPISSVARGTAAGIRGIARNVRSYPGRYGLAAVGAGALASAFAGTPRQTATEVGAAAASATATPPNEPRTIRDITPTGDPITDAGNAARDDVAGINRQYNNILRELQSMYQLSETDEERERLRFMLADIEAQRDAGLQAISEGYAQTVAIIRQRGETTRERGQEQGRQFGSELEGYADRTAQRMMLQNLEQQQQFRGLGSGSRNPVNEWVGLMSAMAPLQQQYTQRMGDITAEGIDWMADTTSAQGQAQLADLQRLAAATRSAGIMGHQRQVADRIQRDSEALRAATLQTLMQQANAAQSVGSSSLQPFDRLRAIEDWAASGMGPGYIEQSFRNTGQSSLTPGEQAMIEILNERYLGTDLANAAKTPAPGS
jgi:hypothetical protein